MSWRTVVISSSAKLDYHMGYMVVRKDEEIKMSLMPQKFEREEKLEILRILQQEVTIAGRREVVNNAIKIYCKSVFDALNENDTSLIKFYKDEL